MVKPRLAILCTVLYQPGTLREHVPSYHHFTLLSSGQGHTPHPTPEAIAQPQLCLFATNRALPITIHRTLLIPTIDTHLTAAADTVIIIHVTATQNLPLPLLTSAVMVTNKDRALIIILCGCNQLHLPEQKAHLHSRTTRSRK